MRVCERDIVKMTEKEGIYERKVTASINSQIQASAHAQQFKNAQWHAH